jgi:hypothetical protein
MSVNINPEDIHVGALCKIAEELSYPEAYDLESILLLLIRRIKVLEEKCQYIAR